MTRAMHCAAAAISAVTHHRLALALFSYHTDYNCRDNANEYRANYNRPNIAYYPLEHTLNS